jgi:hypothetical protein
MLYHSLSGVQASSAGVVWELTEVILTHALVLTRVDAQPVLEVH